MIDHIKRNRNYIYGWPIIGFIFKNQIFITVLKIIIALLFAYAIAFGIIDDSTDNVFTTGLFWGLFWPFFMVTTALMLNVPHPRVEKGKSRPSCGSTSTTLGRNVG